MSETRLSGHGFRPDPLVVRVVGLRAVVDSAQLRPGASATYRLAYTLPRGRAVGAYSLTMDRQPLVPPPPLRIDVFAPPGQRFAPAREWDVDGDHARWTGRPDRPRTLTLKVRRWTLALTGSR